MANLARTVISRFGDNENTVVVAMNDVRFIQRLPGSIASIGTDAVMIVSPTAAILAHIAPSNPNLSHQSHSSDDPGRENLRLKLREFTGLYGTNRQHFAPGRAVAAAGLRRRDVLANPDAIKAIDEWATRIGLPNILWRSYGPVTRESTPAESTAIAILWRPDDAMPSVYLNSSIVVEPTSLRIMQYEEKVHSAVNALHRLKDQGNSDEQATAQMITELQRRGRTPSAAANEVHALLAIGRLRRQGTSMNDAISQLVARLVSLGNSDADARARVAAALDNCLSIIAK